MATPAVQLDELFATTFQKVRGTLADQITHTTKLLAALDSKAKVTEDGGLTIRRPVLFELNDTVGSYDGYDPIDVTPQDGFGYAEYSWKQYAGSVTIDGKTEAVNEGSARIIAILEAKMEQLRLSMTQDLNTMVWGDGTGNSSKDMLGIQAIVAATAGTTLGGIDAATETWWENERVTGAISLATTAGVKTLNSILNSLSVVNSKPDFEFTTQANFESYEALAVPNIRFQDLHMAELGFEAVSHKGAELMFEDDVPANAWYFLNSDHLEFVQKDNRWMKLLGFRSPVDQDAKTALVVSMGNLITDVRRAHGVATNVS
jgi:hypothetical protein